MRFLYSYVDTGGEPDGGPPDKSQATETGSTSARMGRTHPLAIACKTPIQVLPLTKAPSTIVQSINSAGSGRTTRSESFRNVHAKFATLVHPQDTCAEFTVCDYSLDKRLTAPAPYWYHKGKFMANTKLHLSELKTDIISSFIKHNQIYCPNCRSKQQHTFIRDKFVKNSTDQIWPQRQEGRGIETRSGKTAASYASSRGLLTGEVDVQFHLH